MSRTTRLFRRGSFLDPGEVVEPGVPNALDTVPFEASSEVVDRLDLARWLVHPENAPVLRVTVNRWWQALFGRGLVATANDFGVRGAVPSHPDLLEWLAAELPRRGFSRKAILREIVLSRAYRRASAVGSGLRERDPSNVLLARQARLRLPAEAIRDSALRASGLLADAFGGPPVQPPQPDGVFSFTQSRKTWKPSEGPDRYRRTLYTRLWRSSPYPFLTTFDFPNPATSCTARLRSNTPLQALTLANDPMVQELAQALGERVVAEASADDERLERAVRLTLGRAPRPEEVELLRAHATRVRAARSVVDDSEAEVRVWTSVARVLLNTDEFVTRN